MGDVRSKPARKRKIGTGVRVEKKESESQKSRSHKKEKVEQRVNATKPSFGGESATAQTGLSTTHPPLREPIQEVPTTLQREALSAVPLTGKQPITVDNMDKREEEGKFTPQILQHGFGWFVQFCATAILSLLLGFNQPVTHVPILDFIVGRKLTVLAILCVVVLLTAAWLLVSPALYKRLRPMEARLKTMSSVTVVSLLSSMLCLSLLGITLGRPSWCPASLCSPPKVITRPITTTQGSHDTNLDVYFIGFQSAAYVIPDNPAKPDYIPDSSNPRSIGAVQLNAGATSVPYAIAIGLHSLYTGRYSIFIDKVTLLVTKVNALPSPLQVYPVVLPTGYSTTNPARFVYQGQQVHQTIPDTYSTSPSPRVVLTSGEPDQIDAAVESLIPVDMYFRLQVTYHIATQGQHTLILPQTFEVVFSNASNWHKYQLNPVQQNFVREP